MIAIYAAVTIGVTVTVPVFAPILPGERELIQACKRGIAICYEIRFDGSVRRLGGPGATKPEGRVGSLQRTTHSPPGLPESP
jgi:hypothetical protein